MWFENKKPILALAPMADMTDSPFCNICRDVAGKDFVIFREMVSAEAIVRDNEKTLKMCEFDEAERPIIQQIFGPEPDVIVEAAKVIIGKFHPDGIDINMGCPVPKLTNPPSSAKSADYGVTRKGGSGAALMKDPERAVKIVKALKNANLGVPVSVKTRLGWGSNDEILEFTPKLEAAGADLISIHGRTKSQGYSGKANWEMIGRVKKKLSIPVIANGDVKTREDIEKCLEVTQADGVMIGRGVLGNPWILRITPSFDGAGSNADLRIDIKERIDVVLKHAKLHIEHYGEKYGLRTFRKHLVWYFKTDCLGRNISGIKKFRSKLVKVSNLEELESLLKEFSAKVG